MVPWAVVQATPSTSLGQVELEALTTRTQEGGTEVVQAKAGKVGPPPPPPPLPPPARPPARVVGGSCLRHSPCTAYCHPTTPMLELLYC